MDGQSEYVHRKFGMAKGAQAKRKQIPAPPAQRVLQRTFIHQWRKHAGLTQTDVATFLGVSTATVSQIENAETGYKQEYLEGIAELVGCEPSDLLTRGPNDPQPIWRLWEAASGPQRKLILKMAAAVLDPNGQ